MNISHHSQGKLSRFIDKVLLNALPSNLVHWFQKQYNDLVKRIASKQSSIYKLKKRVGKYRSVLVFFGVLDHKSRTASSVSPSSIYRRKRFMRRHHNCLDSVTTDLVNLAGEFAYHYIHDSVTQNQIVDTRITKLLHKSFVRDHNLIVSEFDQNHDIKLHRAFQCILNGWSTNSLRSFRLAVCS